GVQNLQQQRSQQFLRSNRGPPPPRIQCLEVQRHSLQPRIHHGPNPPQRMIRRYPLFRVDVAEHRSLLLVVSTHSYSIPHCLVETLVSFHAPPHFSAACLAAEAPTSQIRGSHLKHPAGSHH